MRVGLSSTTGASYDTSWREDANRVEDDRADPLPGPNAVLDRVWYGYLGGGIAMADQIALGGGEWEAAWLGATSPDDMVKLYGVVSPRDAVHAVWLAVCRVTHLARLEGSARVEDSLGQVQQFLFGPPGSPPPDVKGRWDEGYVRPTFGNPPSPSVSSDALADLRAAWRRAACVADRDAAKDRYVAAVRSSVDDAAAAVRHRRRSVAAMVEMVCDSLAALAREASVGPPSTWVHTWAVFHDAFWLEENSGMPRGSITNTVKTFLPCPPLAAFAPSGSSLPR